MNTPVPVRLSFQQNSAYGGGSREEVQPAQSVVPRDNKDPSESGLAEHKGDLIIRRTRKATERRFPVTKTPSRRSRHLR
jgi:hypothetical protein